VAGSRGVFLSFSLSRPRHWRPVAPAPAASAQHLAFSTRPGTAMPSPAAQRGAARPAMRGCRSHSGRSRVNRLVQTASRGEKKRPCGSSRTGLGRLDP
jgi:hypothetical protein